LSPKLRFHTAPQSSRCATRAEDGRGAEGAEVGFHTAPQSSRCATPLCALPGPPVFRVSIPLRSLHGVQQCLHLSRFFHRLSRFHTAPQSSRCATGSSWWVNCF